MASILSKETINPKYIPLDIQDKLVEGLFKSLIAKGYCEHDIDPTRTKSNISYLPHRDEFMVIYRVTTHDHVYHDYVIYVPYAELT